MVLVFRAVAVVSGSASLMGADMSERPSALLQTLLWVLWDRSILAADSVVLCGRQFVCSGSSGFSELKG